MNDQLIDQILDMHRKAARGDRAWELRKQKDLLGELLEKKTGLERQRDRLQYDVDAAKNAGACPGLTIVSAFPVIKRELAKVDAEIESAIATIDRLESVL